MRYAASRGAGGASVEVFRIKNGCVLVRKQVLSVGINAQRGTVKSGDQRVAHFGMFTGGHQRSRLPTCHLLRKAWAAERACSQINSYLFPYFVGEKPKRL